MGMRRTHHLRSATSSFSPIHCCIADTIVYLQYTVVFTIPQYAATFTLAFTLLRCAFRGGSRRTAGRPTAVRNVSVSAALPHCQIPQWAAFIWTAWGHLRRCAYEAGAAGARCRALTTLRTAACGRRAARAGLPPQPCPPASMEQGGGPDTADLRRHAPMTGAVGSRSDADERRLVTAIRSRPRRY